MGDDPAPQELKLAMGSLRRLLLLIALSTSSCADSKAIEPRAQPPRPRASAASTTPGSRAGNVPCHHSDPIVDAAFAPDGNKVVSWSKVELVIWDVAAGKCSRVRPVEGVSVARWRGDAMSRLTVVALTSTRIIQWDTDDRITEQTIEAGHVTSVSPDGSHAATVLRNGVVHLYDTRTGTHHQMTSTLPGGHPEADPRVVDWPNQGKELAIAGTSGLEILNVETRTRVRQCKRCGYDTSVSPDGKIGTASLTRCPSPRIEEDAQICQHLLEVRDLDTGRPLTTIRRSDESDPNQPVKLMRMDLLWEPLGKLALLVTEHDIAHSPANIGAFTLYDTRTWRIFKPMGGVAGPVRLGDNIPLPSFDPTGSKLLVPGLDEGSAILRLFDLRGDRSVGTFPSDSGPFVGRPTADAFCRAVTSSSFETPSRALRSSPWAHRKNQYEMVVQRETELPLRGADAAIRNSGAERCCQLWPTCG